MVQSAHVGTRRPETENGSDSLMGAAAFFSHVVLINQIWILAIKV